MKKRLPKYIILPLALLIYFLVMAAYGINRNNGILPEGFWTIVAVELVVIVVLFFVLKKMHNRRNK